MLSFHYFFLDEPLELPLLPPDRFPELLELEERLDDGADRMTDPPELPLLGGRETFEPPPRLTLDPELDGAGLILDEDEVRLRFTLALPAEDEPRLTTLG